MFITTKYTPEGIPLGEVQEEIQAKNEKPDHTLLHLGFKWDASDNP